VCFALDDREVGFNSFSYLGRGMPPVSYGRHFSFSAGKEARTASQRAAA
jgi:hypothetical protein